MEMSSDQEETRSNQDTNNNVPPKLGGSVDDEPCYCLLDGLGGDNERIRVKVTHLPAKLGRLHETDDPHFCSLGTAKAVSREHARLDFRFPGGFLESSTSGAPASQQPETFQLQLDDTDVPDLPETGAYVLTNLSKNKILVNQERLDQDSSLVLESGTAIKLGPVCVYFLLPTTPLQGEPTVASTTADTTTATAATEPTTKPHQQQRWSLDVSSAMPVAAKSLMVKEESSQGNKATSSTHLQLEALSWKDLSDQYHTASTERRRQIVQSVIVARGALDAVKAMRQLDVSANEVIEWLEQSERYGPFQNEMKERMEAKSYKASITKALLRAGFSRNNALGPRVRWHVPEAIRNELETATTLGSNNNEEEEDDEDPGENENEEVAAAAQEDNEDDEEDDDDNPKDRDIAMED